MENTNKKALYIPIIQEGEITMKVLRPYCDKCGGEEFEDKKVEGELSVKRMKASEYVKTINQPLIKPRTRIIKGKLICKGCKAEYPYEYKY